MKSGTSAAPRIEMIADPSERQRCGRIIDDEVERGPGEEDRPVGAPEGHLLDRCVVHDHLDAGVRSRPTQRRQHVGRRIEALDVEPLGPQGQRGSPPPQPSSRAGSPQDRMKAA